MSDSIVVKAPNCACGCQFAVVEFYCEDRIQWAEEIPMHCVTEPRENPGRVVQALLDALGGSVDASRVIGRTLALPEPRNFFSF